MAAPGLNAAIVQFRQYARMKGACGKCRFESGWRRKLGKQEGKAVEHVAQLTPRQQRFCDEYLIDLNATQAAIRAGYSARSARQIADKNMSKDDIREYIEKRMAEKEDALIAKQDEVLKYLTAVMRRELYEHVVVTVTEEKSHYAPDANGTMRKCTKKKETPQTVKIPARLADANKAAELLGRRYGLFTDNLEVNGPIPIVISGGEALED